MLKTLMIGHLGQDATVKVVANSNQQAIQFSVAHSEKWRDQQGVQREKTTWVNCTYWREPGKTNVAEYLKKGQLVYIEGEISSYAFIGKENGEMQHGMQMRVNRLELLGGSVGNKQPQAQQQHPQGQIPNTQAVPQYAQQQQVQQAQAQPVYTNQQQYQVPPQQMAFANQNAQGYIPPMQQEDTPF